MTARKKKPVTKIEPEDAWPAPPDTGDAGPQVRPTSCRKCGARSSRMRYDNGKSKRVAPHLQMTCLYCEHTWREPTLEQRKG